MKKILVIGAGYAGVLTTKHLAKKFKNKEEVEITIIDRNSYHTMLTELHEVAAGRVHEDSIKMDLKDIFANRNVNVVLDEIVSIDFDGKVAKSDSTEYSYDYIVIGTGSKPTFFGTPGVEHAFQLWSYEDAVKLRDHILTMFRMAMSVKDKVERMKLLSFVVVGSGFTGVEMAGELGEWKDELCESFHIPLDEVTITIMDRVDCILPSYPKKLTDKVAKRFSKLGVDILCGAAVCELHEDHIVLEGGKTLDTHTVIWAAGVEGSTLVDKVDDIAKKGRGRFETNAYLQSVDRKDVYIVGDNIFYIPKGCDQPVPQMVENAELCSKLVCHNLVVDLKGGTYKEYEPVFQGSMVCVGGKWGVAYIGKKEKKTALSGFMAMFVKHFVNMIYFMEVLGLHKIYSYLKHEIFTVKRNRSLVGGHLSNENSIPGFALFPLRIFLGVMWLISGLTKLPAILNDWTHVFLLPPSPAADGSSGASEAVNGALEATADAASSASTLLETATNMMGDEVATPISAVPEGIEGVLHNLGQIFELSAAKAAPVPEFISEIMNWVNQTFFWASDGGFTTFAAIAQSGMVATEIVIGLMFIAGFLTPLAGIISFVLMIVIYFSGWSYISIFFFGFAGLACMFSGNVLGLDYYFLPWLNKKLRQWKLTKKWYLYFR